MARPTLIRSRGGEARVMFEIPRKTPVLGDLPIAGRLFRNSARTNDKDELLIFITPRIIREGVRVR